MNASEGIRRIAKAFRLLGDGIGILGLLTGVIMLFLSADGWKVVSVLSIFAAVISGIGRLISWIILGFVDPARDN